MKVSLGKNHRNSGGAAGEGLGGMALLFTCVTMSFLFMTVYQEVNQHIIWLQRAPRCPRQDTEQSTPGSWCRPVSRGRTAGPASRGPLCSLRSAVQSGRGAEAGPQPPPLPSSRLPRGSRSFPLLLGASVPRGTPPTQGLSLTVWWGQKVGEGRGELPQDASHTVTPVAGKGTIDRDT